MSEYAKLASYDGLTADQPAELFLCHQHGSGSAQARLCAGWVACHGRQRGDELLALRVGLLSGALSEAEFDAACSYSSSLPIFPSGAAAAVHGCAGVDDPDEGACRLIEKIRERRDLP